jgi:putative transposase
LALERGRTTKQTRFTEEQIIGLLKKAEASAKTPVLAPRHGLSEATICNWKAKYGGLEVSEAKRLRSLKEGNAKLKRLLADTVLDNAALKDLLSKNGDVCRDAGSGCASSGKLRDERAAGVPSCWG